MTPPDLVLRCTEILKVLDRLDPPYAEEQRTRATRACLSFGMGKTADATRFLTEAADHAKTSDERHGWLRLVSAVADDRPVGS